MSMGIVSDTEFESELENLEKESKIDVNDLTNKNGRVIQKDKPGRKEGDNNVPDSLRKMIGEVAIESGRGDAVNLAKEFGVSASSASAYANGAVSTKTYNEPSQSLSEHVDSVRNSIATRAKKKVLKALGHITEEKLLEAKARELAGIAKDLSGVVREMDVSVNNNGNSNQTPQFIIYAPQFVKEDRFDIVDLSDK